MKSMYQEYCTGCGMCQSVFNTKLSKSEKGFLFPDDGLVEKRDLGIQRRCDDRRGRERAPRADGTGRQRLKSEKKRPAAVC